MAQFSRLAYERLLYMLPEQYPYDPQPHPENPDLASTFPHHHHEPPDIKHNRRPAPGISFQAPNLPTLIADCIALGET